MVNHVHHRYGYWDLGSQFREMLRFEESGLMVRGRRLYPWREVVGLRAYPDFHGDVVLGWLTPLLLVYFADGSVLFIRGRHLRPDCRDCQIEKKAGLPGPYVEVVERLRVKGVGNWKGPREEMVLLQSGMALGIFAFVTAYGLAARLGWPSPVDVGIPVAVIAANLAFVLLPTISRRVRRRFLSAKAALSKSGTPSPGVE